MLQSQKVRHDRVTEQHCSNRLAQGGAEPFRRLVANFYNLKTKKIPPGRVTLSGWLRCYRVGNRVDILSSMESGNWPV